jgi:hypothetical protein
MMAKDYGHIRSERTHLLFRFVIYIINKYIHFYVTDKLSKYNRLEDATEYVYMHSSEFYKSEAAGI